MIKSVEGTNRRICTVVRERLCHETARRIAPLKKTYEIHYAIDTTFL